ncbi:MAG TPA: succinyl-diaminopimelate desuccinylase [Actinomycetota bacterium]|nr:succinyl-diaminopimelate desuccinylase [Actinomycetota bacterium]
MSLGEHLATTTLSLVDVASESRHEGPVLDLLAERLASAPGLRLEDAGDAVRWFAPAGRRRDVPMVVLAGHADTVPVGGAVFPGRREGDAVIGRGAADMKGGLAVLVALAEAGASSAAFDVGYLVIGREELPIVDSALLPLLDRSPSVREASLAIVLEPTANALEVGCNGNLTAHVWIEGVAAHSARPWLGDNAITTALEVLGPLTRRPPRNVELEGLVFREVVSVTRIEGGTADNVVPDRVSATVNLRYAPDRSPAEAEADLRSALGDDRRVHLEIVGNAPPGPVVLANPFVERLRAAGELAVAPKQAWTPVAEFATVGVDAVNFGPGDPRYAHHDEERVEIGALVRAYEVLRAFLAGAGRT